jgi:hypothetical protein
MNLSTTESLELRIARLEGRIAALENALDRRARELRLLQATLCPADLVQLARITDGLSPLPRVAHQLEYWNESTVIAPADLATTLEDLWASLTPSSGVAGALPPEPCLPVDRLPDLGAVGPLPGNP